MAIDDGLLYEAPVRVKYYPDGSTFLVWTAPDGATVQVPWEDDPEGARAWSREEPKNEPNWKALTERLFYALRGHRASPPERLKECGVCDALIRTVEEALSKDDHGDGDD